VRKKKNQRLGSELLQISREPWSIVGRLQLWNTSTSTSSVADLQRDHRTIDCLALTDVEISICCSVASLHPHFLCQLVQVSSSAFSPQLFRIPLRICAMEGSVSYPEHILIMRD
jgi:hypothetical protein